MTRTTLLAAASAMVALCALAFTLHAGHPVQAHLVHSDALYLPVLFEDVLRRSGSLGDWFLTPAPYFFPDFLLYLPAWLAAGSMLGQTTLFALLQTVLTAGAVFLVARTALPGAGLQSAAALATLLVWLGLHADDPFVRLFSSAHHYGAFIAALLLAALWLGLDGSRRRRPMEAAAALLVYLATLSDALFLVQAVMPLLAAALLHRRDAGTATAPRRAVLLLLAPAVLAMVSYRFVVAHPTRYPARLGLDRLSANLGETGTIFATLFGQQPLLAAALSLALLAGLACIAACLRRGTRLALPYQVRLLLTFAALSCAATMAVMLLSTTVQPVPRYLITPLSALLVAGWFALAARLGPRSRFAAAGLALVFSSLLVADAWQLRGQHSTARYFYPEQVACIDQALGAAGARHGIAQYWDAKRLQGLSRHQLTVAQYTGELAPMEWITSQRFFAAGYDFAIVAGQEAPPFRLPREQLIALGGEPVRTVDCGDRSVLLFEPGRLRVPSAAQPASR